VNDERGCKLLKCASWEKLRDCVDVTLLGTFGRPWVLGALVDGGVKLEIWEE